MLHAGPSRDLREAMALRFFAFDAGGPGVLHRIGAPRALQRRAQRRFIVQIALDELGARGGNGLGGLAVGIARQRANLETLAGQRARGGAALLSGCAGN